MVPADVIAVLRRHEPQLRARGIRHAALFGSRARGDAHADSDIDILIAFDPQARIGIYDYAAARLLVSDLIGSPVDVVAREALHPDLRARVEAEAVYAF